MTGERHKLLKPGSWSWEGENCTVHLVVDTVKNGIAIGGLRMSSGGTLQETVELAGAMTDKLTLFGVAAGGAKVVVGPKPGRDFAAVRGEVAEALSAHLRAGFLVGEDVGVTSDEVREIYDLAGFDPIENTIRIVGGHGVQVQMPPAELAQLLTRQYSGRLAGEGVLIVLRAMGLARQGQKIRVSIQGAGSVGGTIASLMAADPAFEVIGLSDKDHLVWSPDGLDTEWITRNVDEHGSISISELKAGASVGEPGEWMLPDAQVLVAAALGGSITHYNADAVPPGALCVVEAANHAVSDAAAGILAQRGITVVPGALANAFTSVCFGLMATGQATMETVHEIYGERVAQLVEGLR